MICFLLKDDVNILCDVQIVKNIETRLFWGGGGLTFVLMMQKTFQQGVSLPLVM